MNRDEIRKNLERAIGQTVGEDFSFEDMSGSHRFDTNSFIEQIYISDEISYIRVDIYKIEDNDSKYMFRISGFDPENDALIKRRNIDNIFYLGLR